MEVLKTITVELTDEQLQLIVGNSDCLFDSGEPKWYHMPYIFTKVVGNTYQVQTINELPERVRDFFKKGANTIFVDKKTPLDMVREFHEYAGHPIEVNHKFPETKEHDFRVSFMIEETGEADGAFLNEDLIKYADSLGDLQYVLDGWFLASGLWTKKQEIMEEIHRSNMTKFCNTVEEAQATIDKLMTVDCEKYDMDNTRVLPYITAYYYDEVGDYFIVKRSSDNKVMKGINYEPPKLEEIIYGKTGS